MPRYDITVCDGERCRKVGTAGSESAAKKRVKRELEKAARKAKRGDKEGRIHVEARERKRGVPAEDPIYEAEVSVGPPARRRKRSSTTR